MFPHRKPLLRYDRANQERVHRRFHEAMGNILGDVDDLMESSPAPVAALRQPRRKRPAPNQLIRTPEKGARSPVCPPAPKRKRSERDQVTPIPFVLDDDDIPSAAPVFEPCVIVHFHPGFAPSVEKVFGGFHFSNDNVIIDETVAEPNLLTTVDGKQMLSLPAHDTGVYIIEFDMYGVPKITQYWIFDGKMTVV